MSQPIPEVELSEHDQEVRLKLIGEIEDKINKLYSEVDISKLESFGMASGTVALDYYKKYLLDFLNQLKLNNMSQPMVKKMYPVTPQDFSG